MDLYIYNKILHEKEAKILGNDNLSVKSQKGRGLQITFFKGFIFKRKFREKYS